MYDQEAPAKGCDPLTPCPGRKQWGWVPGRQSLHLQTSLHQDPGAPREGRAQPWRAADARSRGALWLPGNGGSQGPGNGNSGQVCPCPVVIYLGPERAGGAASLRVGVAALGVITGKSGEPLQPPPPERKPKLR